jgi:EAL domain-containing protein (putative c-di-GMP-specific phosphodiesterase class I)
MKKEARRILLVAHHAPTSAAWAKELGHFDAEIISCEEIEAAQALLSQETAHILVTELIFDAANGLEGLKLARHVVTHFPETLIVIVCEQHLVNEMRELSLKAGAHLVLQKNQSLSQTILDWLQDSSFLKTFDNSSATKPAQHLSRLDTFLDARHISALMQPIVSLRSEAYPTLGIESLARGLRALSLWNPEIFFAYAAKKERLFDTDMFCIKAALKEACVFKNQGKLFINVSSCSFINQKFTAQVFSLCEEFGYLGEKIVFELTEQQAIVNQKAFFLSLKELRNKGFAIALDDFGVGFASLQLVQDLKPDYIKLSGVFCRDLEKDKTKQAIIKATTQLSKHLRIPTILEQVETSAELEMAHSLGIDNAQGYYFCHPKKSNSLIRSNWFLKHPFLSTS